MQAVERMNSVISQMLTMLRKILCSYFMKSILLNIGIAQRIAAIKAKIPILSI